MTKLPFGGSSAQFKAAILQVAQIGHDPSLFLRLDLIWRCARHMSSVVSQAYTILPDIHRTMRQTPSAQQI
jgi:hypothetical protein